MSEKDTDDELNLPVIKDEPLPPAIRSMDEVDKWIEEDERSYASTGSA
jgi:hypothetical protein